ncbi:MAG: hypothetical protein NC421_11355 [Lachnospiraceae bacterium]|nr:hypothetical protein [Lachnospiraceae bacterium]
MNKVILSLLLLIGMTCQAEISNSELQRVNEKVEILTLQFENLIGENKSLKRDVSNLQSLVESLNTQLHTMETKSDSIYNALMSEVTSNTELANANHAAATERIQVVETYSKNKIHKLTVWGIWAIVLLLIIAIVVYIILHRNITNSKDAISTIRDVQNKLEEESVKLDTKLVELLDNQIQKEKQIKQSVSKVAPALDHTLALKLADEITRIEKNLSRMDPSVKGYKPLVKAIERIKDNFKANGYEIATYIGQPYNEGMRVNADFVIDEELPEGTRTITSVSKPQVHYNGELIQKATITVTQNI